MKLRPTSRLQSAMEYLMTYGWSILIIAIVLVALFSLGVFSNSNLGPRAEPNSCRVYRPYGPASSQNINLEGVCNGELPQYVAQLNGLSSNVPLGSSVLSFTTSDFTISAWVKPLSTSGSWQAVVNKGDGSSAAGSQYEIIYNFGSSQQFRFDVFIGASNDQLATSTAYPISTWYFITATRHAGADSIYINGALAAGPTTYSGTLNNVASLAIGSPGSASGDFFNGLIADVQFYNVSIDANAIQSLYQEGIGGAPIEPQYLVAWYPLNGDGNDYGGNNYNGAPNNVIFTSTWTSGYTTP